MHDTATPSGGGDAALPETVRRYQDAHDRQDIDVALSAFGPDAAVFDDGKEFHGIDEIRTWLTTTASEYTFTRTLVSADAVDDETWVVVNHLEGNFPGAVVDLRYKFMLSGERISELVIAP